MNFSGLIGQSLLVDRLKSIISGERVAHAYLFIGPKGAGKKTLANFFARGLLCTSKEDKPCGVCSSCRQFLSGNHPDVMYIRSDKTVIGVGLIREMLGSVYVKPYQSDRKVYIIEKANTMTPQAQNALLKTLEEPPSFVNILLIADNASGLLPTVLSRCQRLIVSPLSHDEISKILIQNSYALPDEAALYARLSEGLPGRAIQISSSTEFKELREETLKILERLYKLKTWQVFDYASFFIDNKNNCDDMLDIIVLWLRDVLVYKETGMEDLIINMDKISSIKSYASVFTTTHIKDMIEKVEDTRRMIKSYVNYQLSIENMLMDLCGGEN